MVPPPPVPLWKRPMTLLCGVLVFALYLLSTLPGLAASAIWLWRGMTGWKLTVVGAGLLISAFTGGSPVAWVMRDLFTTRCPSVVEENTRALAESALEFSIDHDGRYPAILEELYLPDEDGVPYLMGSFPPSDPWGRAYNYQPPGEGRELRVWSLGRDGLPGGEGADRDVDQDGYGH